jgi:hypothetical protein
MLAGVEIPAIFHGVQKNFSESEDDSFGNVGISNPTKELDQAICGGDVAASRQVNPSGRRRQYFDAVIPARRGHGGTHHFGEFRSIDGSREITEGSLAHGRNDVSWSKSIGEDDQAHVRASTPDSPKNLNIICSEHFPPGDDQVEWLGRRQSESVLIVNGAVNAPAVAGQNARK